MVVKLFRLYLCCYEQSWNFSIYCSLGPLKVDGSESKQKGILLGIKIVCHLKYYYHWHVSLPPSLSPLSVSFPHPSSSLLDIEVIIGDDTKLASLVSAFNSEVTAESYTPWPALEWLTKE